MPTTKPRVMITLDPDIMADAERQAEDRGIPVATYLRSLLRPAIRATKEVDAMKASGLNDA